MNNNTTSQYMDKQIMDLSNSQNTISTHNSNGSNNDFIDFINRPTENTDDIVPSYDFMPIRPVLGSSSPTAARSSNLDSSSDDAPLRTWNSVDTKTNASPVRTYSSPDADESARLILGRNHTSNDLPLDASLVSEIDRTMKKHMDNLVHAVDKISARLSQLETRTRDIESSIDDLKVIVENNHGKTDGKMRLLENVLTEVKTCVLSIRDKQEVFEAQLQISKLQIPKSEQVETKNTTNPGPTHTGISTHQQDPIPPTFPPPQQSNVQPQMQLPNQFPQNQAPHIHQQEPYFPTPNQNPDIPSQQYQLSPPPPQHQYQPQPPPPSQPHPSFSIVNPILPPQPVGHHPEETSYVPSQTYAQGIRPPFGPPPPSQQYHGPNPSIYEPPSSRIAPGLGYSGSFGPSSGHGGELYPYGGSSHVKSQSGYPHLPTAQILQQALPTASSVGGGFGSGSRSGVSDNKVPIDDVVDRVTNMGFPRDQVRATVRKLTEDGQAVDLNVVLDKLMNDGSGQAPRGWFGR
ncbi:hypothetical protein OROMI_032402 [Orobanche minor]